MRGRGWRKWRKWRKWVALAAVAGVLAGQTGVVPVWAEEGRESSINAGAVQEYAPEGESCADSIASVSGGNEEGLGTVDGVNEGCGIDSETAEGTGGSNVVGGNDAVGKDDADEGSGAVEKDDVVQGNNAADPDDGEGMLVEDQMEIQTESLDVDNTAGDIASGKDGDITWVIDADGKLTVEGTGDLPGDHSSSDFAWKPYSSQITSAKINVSRMTDASYLFKNCSNMTSVDVSGFDTSSVTSMREMFDDCSSLTSVDVSKFDTSSVTSMRDMFDGCSSLTSVDVSGFDTSSVTDMFGMFAYCSFTSVDVSGFNTSSVTDMAGMFEGCSSLASVDVSGFDTSNVKDMRAMFLWCRSLASVDVSGFDTSNVKDMSSMFAGCSSLTSLDVSGFDTSSVVERAGWFGDGYIGGMSGMFAGCSSLTSLDVSGFDIRKVTDMSRMFSGCNSLISLNVSGLDTRNVTDMRGMFYNCSSLESLDVSGFDTSNVADMRDMFEGCANLKNIKTPYIMGIKTTELPTTFIAPNGTETQIMSKEFCNTTLTRKKFPKPAPVKFTVVGVVGGRNVTFNNDSEDAVIYYSAKTSNLTTADTCVKPGETVLFENFYGTIYAKAYANGQWSNVSRLVLKIPVVNKPTTTSKDGVVTIKTTTPDSYIYYTTDGSTPSPTNGTRLAKSGGSFTVPVNCTVKAIAVRSCFTNSEVASVSVTAKKLGAPSFVVKGVIGGREVTFNSTEAQGEIYYSFTTSNITTKDLHVKPGEKVLFQNYYGTVYAKTYVNGQWSNASRLILKIPVVNRPTIIAAGAGKVKISTSTPNCAIYYTTDGSTPSPTNGTRINSSSSIVTVGSGKTVKAIAVRSCFTNSDVATYR